jgi:hypothetical protein
MSRDKSRAKTRRGGKAFVRSFVAGGDDIRFAEEERRKDAGRWLDRDRVLWIWGRGKRKEKREKRQRG